MEEQPREDSGRKQAATIPRVCTACRIRMEPLPLLPLGCVSPSSLTRSPGGSGRTLQVGAPCSPLCVSS